jgi:hypothetical protein
VVSVVKKHNLIQNKTRGIWRVKDSVNGPCRSHVAKGGNRDEKTRDSENTSRHGSRLCITADNISILRRLEAYPLFIKNKIILYFFPSTFSSLSV